MADQEGGPLLREGLSGEAGQGARAGSPGNKWGDKGQTEEMEKERPNKQGQSWQGQSQHRNGLGVWQLGGMMSMRSEHELRKYRREVQSVLSGAGLYRKCERERGWSLVSKELHLPKHTATKTLLPAQNLQSPRPVIWGPEIHLYLLWPLFAHFMAHSNQPKDTTQQKDLSLLTKRLEVGKSSEVQNLKKRQVKTEPPPLKKISKPVFKDHKRFAKVT